VAEGPILRPGSRLEAVAHALPHPSRMRAG
jgi:hypothetical protein